MLQFGKPRVTAATAAGTARERRLRGGCVRGEETGLFIVRRSVGTECHAGHRPLGEDAGPALGRSDLLCKVTVPFL